MKFHIFITAFVLIVSCSCAFAQDEERPPGITTSCNMTAPPVLYFDRGVTLITDADRARLDTLLCVMNEYPTLSLRIYCYAEPDEIAGGDSTTRYHLAMLRAEFAKSYLLTKGFPSERISMRDMTAGKLSNASQLANRHPHGRRIEFYLTARKK